MRCFSDACSPPGPAVAVERRGLGQLPPASPSRRRATTRRRLADRQHWPHAVWRGPCGRSQSVDTRHESDACHLPACLCLSRSARRPSLPLFVARRSLSLGLRIGSRLLGHCTDLVKRPGVPMDGGVCLVNPVAGQARQVCDRCPMCVRVDLEAGQMSLGPQGPPQGLGVCEGRLRKANVTSATSASSHWLPFDQLLSLCRIRRPMRPSFPSLAVGFDLAHMLVDASVGSLARVTHNVVWRQSRPTP